MAHTVIRGCHCDVCRGNKVYMAKHGGASKIRRIKNEGNRRFRHATRQAIRIEVDVPERVAVGYCWD